MANTTAVLKEYAKKVADDYGLPRNIFLALFNQESGWNPNAISPAGAMGVGQFMPATAKAYGIDPMNPYQSIDATGRYLSANLRTYRGDWRKTLASYNAGAGAVAKYGGVPPYKETQNYVNSILKAAGVPPTSPVVASSAASSPRLVGPSDVQTNLATISQRVAAGAPRNSFSYQDPALSAPAASVVFDPTTSTNNFIDLNSRSVKLGAGGGGFLGQRAFGEKIDPSRLTVVVDEAGNPRTFASPMEARSAFNQNSQAMRNNTLRGVGTGAAIGTALFPGVGTVLGALGGAAYGALKGNKAVDTAATQLYNASQDLGDAAKINSFQTKAVATLADAKNRQGVMAGGPDASSYLNEAVNSGVNPLDIAGSAQAGLYENSAFTRNRVAKLQDDIASQREVFAQKAMRGEQLSPIEQAQYMRLNQALSQLGGAAPDGQAIAANARALQQTNKTQDTATALAAMGLRAQEAGSFNTALNTQYATGANERVGLRNADVAERTGLAQTAAGLAGTQDTNRTSLAVAQEGNKALAAEREMKYAPQVLTLKNTTRLQELGRTLPLTAGTKSEEELLNDPGVAEYAALTGRTVPQVVSELASLTNRGVSGVVGAQLFGANKPTQSQMWEALNRLFGGQGPAQEALRRQTINQAQTQNAQLNTAGRSR